MALSGMPDNHRKLHVLCLSQMKSVWEVKIGNKFIFCDLVKPRFVNAGGHLDHHGSVPYDQYVALLGKFLFFFGCIFFLQT